MSKRNLLQVVLVEAAIDPLRRQLNFATASQYRRGATSALKSAYGAGWAVFAGCPGLFVAGFVMVRIAPAAWAVRQRRHRPAQVSAPIMIEVVFFVSAISQAFMRRGEMLLQ